MFPLNIKKRCFSKVQVSLYPEFNIPIIKDSFANIIIFFHICKFSLLIFFKNSTIFVEKLLNIFHQPT